MKKTIRKISELDQQVIDLVLAGGQTYRSLEAATGANYNGIRRLMSDMPHLRSRVLRKSVPGAKPAVHKNASGTLELF